METIDDVLEHYGIKGMRWGVRRTEEQLARARGRRVKETSEDAKGAKESLKKARKQGTQALSNKELQALNQRLNLEQQYARLTAKPSRLKRGEQAIKTIIGVGNTVNEVVKFASSPTGKQIATLLGQEQQKQEDEKDKK